MGYLEKTVKGTLWVGSFRAGSRLIAFAKIAVIARILMPGQFGAIGIATLVLAFLEIFTETGINTVLIQQKEKIHKYLNTAWLISIARGFIVFLAITLSAGFISNFFDSASSYRLLILISYVPLIRGFINPAVVRLQKELAFKKEFAFKLSIFAFDAIVAVVVTVLTRNEAGLIWGFIAGAVLEVVLSYLFISPIPRFEVNFQIFKKIIKDGKWITASGVFQYLFSQGDDIVVGKLLGEAPLGIYQNAYKLSTLPVSEITDVVGRVTFPIYVKISADKKRLIAFFSKIFITNVVLVSVIGIFIYMFADLIVFVLLGHNWSEAVPILKILSVFGILKGVLASFNSLFLSLNKQYYVTNITFMSFVILAILIYPLTRLYGLHGAAYAAIAGTTTSLPIAVYYFMRETKNS